MKRRLSRKKSSIGLTRVSCLVLILFLAGCAKAESLCFSETPKMIQSYYENRTEYSFEGDLILTTCPNDVIVVDENDDRKSFCIIDGERWECPKNKYCNEEIVGGFKMGVCKPKGGER